ncbi:ABC transporter permease [Fusobacterium sp.]|uniref:ABC transporter permease n=1 Tax=Fusobacterium sp. TaxID=68766 RepID=UPI002629AFBF|nr:ABC transporter permease [Fusobacterium sp.]
MFKKIINILILFFITSCIAFMVTRIIPGDPRIAYLNTFNLPLTEDNLKYIEREMGLNIPIWKQYYIWLKNILNLNLGKSYINGLDVYNYMKVSFIYSLKLMIFSIGIIIFISFPLGIFSAIKQNTVFDKIIKGLSLIGMSFPKFWLGYIFISLLGVKLKLLPISGAYAKNSIILPGITLSLSYIGYYTQLIKENILMVLKKDFIKYAKLRGVNKKRIMINYALLNSLTPIITSFGKTVGSLLGGTVIIENIFAWPGLGKMIVEAIDGRDYPIIQGYIFLVSTLFIISTEISSLICYWINPRMKEKEE